MLVHGRHITDCDNCDYDLEGLSALDRCPECGRELKQMDLAPVLADLARTSFTLGVTAAAMSLSVILSPIGGVLGVVGLAFGLAGMWGGKIAPRLRRRAAIGNGLSCFAIVIAVVVVWALS